MHASLTLVVGLLLIVLLGILPRRGFAARVEPMT